MADHGTPDVNDYVLYLRHIAETIENIGKSCQEICRVQQQTIATAQRLVERQAGLPEEAPLPEMLPRREVRS